MPIETQDYVPNMSDAAVKAKTGKDWAGWFGALDKAGAAQAQASADRASCCTRSTACRAGGARW